jgi:hypothetical protein
MTGEGKVPEGAETWDFDAQRGSISFERNEAYDYRIGHIVTPHGIVGFYDQGRLSGDQEALTRLDVVANGRCLAATWRRTFSDRFLITLAKRFAASITPSDDGAARLMRAAEADARSTLQALDGAK